MQLESLKSSKFEVFKGDEIPNPLLIVGGAPNEKTHCTNMDGSHIQSDTIVKDGSTQPNTSPNIGDLVFGMVAKNPKINIVSIANANLAGPDIQNYVVIRDNDD